MSMYHLVHGENPYARDLLNALGVELARIPRYRDCWWDGTHICIYTRTGGGNRAAYAEQNADLTTIDGYVRDQDDPFDSTYATFYYDPGSVLREQLKAVPVQDATSPQRWQAAIERMQTDPDHPQVKRVIEAFGTLFDDLRKKKEP